VPIRMNGKIAEQVVQARDSTYMAIPSGTTAYD